jgi:hypothetical protein
MRVILSFLILACVYGWAANLVKLVLSLEGDLTLLFIGRLVGLFLAPLGVILGYF